MAQNPYVESFGSRIRDELLSGELFETLAEAQVLIEDWRVDYNTKRPHSALGMVAPARFAASWRRTDHQINRLSLAVDRSGGVRSPAVSTAMSCRSMSRPAARLRRSRSSSEATATSAPPISISSARAGEDPRTAAPPVSPRVRRRRASRASS